MQKTCSEKTLIEAPVAVASSPVPSATPPGAGGTPPRSDIPTAPADEAGGGSLPATRDIAVEMGFYSLRLRVAADVDLDDRFRATCLDTGDALWVNGWLIDSNDDIEPAQVLA